MECTTVYCRCVLKIVSAGRGVQSSEPTGPDPYQDRIGRKWGRAARIKRVQVETAALKLESSLVPYVCGLKSYVGVEGGAGMTLPGVIQPGYRAGKLAFYP